MLPQTRPMKLARRPSEANMFHTLSRFILGQAAHASNTQDNMWKLFGYGGRISALAEGDRVEELVEG